MLLSAKDLNRFWSKVEKTEGGCWLWIAAIDKDGYGQFGLGGKLMRAHRVSYEISEGPISKGYSICHTCDVSGCVNPDHLWAGTPADNHRDACKKGRNTRGERAGNVKLTEKQVKRIRQQHAAGKTQKELAKEYEVKPPAIYKIVTRRTWAHV